MRAPRAGLVAAVAAAALALPASATAASTNSQVTGITGAELSLVAATPAQMVITHAVPGATSSLVAVTSTQPAWNLSIKDGGGDATLGRMDKCNALGVLDNPLASLTNPLEWKVGANAFAPLSGVDAAVGAGSLVQAYTVDFQQSLGTAEAVTAGSLYCLSVTYTAV
jgi:hypothetical protein